MNYLKRLKVDLFEQYHVPEIEYKPHTFCWKFYPPRLRVSAHEVVLDNDVLIIKRIPELDEFLKSNKILLHEGKQGIHGKYHPRTTIKINSAIYGFPPDYDFAADIKIIQQNEKDRKWVYGDDQGILAVISTGRDYILLPRKNLPIAPRDVITRTNYGWHFAGINRNNGTHGSWAQFKSNLVKFN